MNLQSYIGKLVKLTLTNNKILIGKVIDFDDKVDNFDGYNSIEIDTGRIHMIYQKIKLKLLFYNNSILSTQIKRKRCYFLRFYNN
ncbi:Uncharacterised protein [Staphylococcus aureus]|nr:Uncharacterised protein [Staphylococcus aureus]